MLHVDAKYSNRFQSTLPLRGATRVRGDGATVLVISIHTPLAGSDMIRYGTFTLSILFQSTLPLRGATVIPSWEVGSRTISIHTPLAGSDALPFMSLTSTE